jgi:hypothetical protein
VLDFRINYRKRRRKPLTGKGIGELKRRLFDGRET